MGKKVTIKYKGKTRKIPYILRIYSINHTAHKICLQDNRCIVKYVLGTVVLFDILGVRVARTQNVKQWSPMIFTHTLQNQ